MSNYTSVSATHDRLAGYTLGQGRPIEEIERPIEEPRQQEVFFTGQG